MSKSISKDVHTELVKRSTNIEVGLTLSAKQSRAERRAALIAAIKDASRQQQADENETFIANTHNASCCYA